MDIIELKRELKETRDEAKSLLEKEDRNEEDVEKATELVKRAEEIKAEVELRERLGSFGNVEVPEVIKPDPGDPPPNETKGFDSFGEQLSAIVRASVPGPERHVDERLIYRGETRGASGPSGANEAAPSAGGFLLQTDFSQEIWKKAHMNSVFAQRCRRVPISSSSNKFKMNAVDETSRANGSRWGGIRVYRVNEAGTVTATKPKFRQIEMSLEKMMGLCYATDELLEDTTALESVVMQGFTEEMAFKLDDEIVRGSGAGECLGMLNAGCLVSQGAETNQTADTIIAENVINMYSLMPADCLGRGEWFINSECFPQLFQMHIAVGTGGIPVFLPPGGLSSAPYGSLLGRPIVPSEHCEELGTQGDILFADMSQYLIIDKGGVDAASSIHVLFIYDEMTFRFTARNNGQPLWDSALTPYQGANDQSPFVALDSRA